MAMMRNKATAPIVIPATHALSQSSLLVVDAVVVRFDICFSELSTSATNVYIVTLLFA